MSVVSKPFASEPEPGAIARRYAAYVAHAIANPRRAALWLAVACVPALVLTALYFADVRAGLQELLPAKAPSVVALNKLHERLGGKSHLTVIAESPDVEANHRFIDELTARMVARKLPEARSIQGSVAVEREWLTRRAPLLLPQKTFDSAMDELEEAVRKAKAKASPFYVDLDEDSGADKGEDAWKRLEKRVSEEAAGKDRFPRGYIETPDGKTVVMLIWLEGNEVDLGPSANLLSAAQQEVAAIRSRYPATLRVAYNGEVPNLVEEHDAILADLSLSSLLVFGLVGALIALYFRSARAVFAVTLGLVPGLLFTFALGRLTAGSLNSNTAFLGSIIAGNGINYPIVFLAYYRACDPSMSMARAIAVAARRALPGTLGAAATASAAYAGLAASSFKGFSQFGWLGGTGMITTWILTFVTMPIAIALLAPPRQGEPHTRMQAVLTRYFAHPWAARLVAVALVGLTLAGTAVGVLRAVRTGLYEMDLKTLRNRESLAHGSASWDRKMNEVFGVWLNPVAALVEDPKDRAGVAAELKRALIDGPEPLAERVETIVDFVPPAEEQEARLVRLRKIAGAIAAVPAEEIPANAKKYVDTWLSDENLKPIVVAEVPATLRQSMAEVSGATDRAVLLYPSLKIDYDNGNNILRFADRLAATKLPGEGTVTGGSFLFMAEIIRMVRDEAPHVVVAVCLLVGGVLIPLYLRRPRRIPVTVLTVAVVALAAQSMMVALGVRVNMLNFAAVPITIGVGADYVVNLFGAMDALETDARQACARMGGAILLCSMTTVVGYFSLVVAQSGALSSFGWAAVLGEIMAVTTVLAILPVVLPREKSVDA